MTNVVKRLIYDDQKDWFNRNNWSIFQSALVSKGATTYSYPSAANSGIEEKLSFLGEKNQVNHFNKNPSEIANNIMVSRNGPQWEKVGDNIQGEAPGDKSGYSVSLSADGSIVAIGSVENDGVNGIDSGHVRVYQYNVSSWQKLGEDIDGEAAGDESGYSISLSADGSILAIGAIYNDGNGVDSGHVRVYQYDGSLWQKIGEDMDGEQAADGGGWSVSLSADGSILAIGAPFNGNVIFSGYVRVYQYNGSSWEQLGGDIDGEATINLSGYSVSLSHDGSLVAIGAPYNNGVNGDNSGHVRVYKYDVSSPNEDNQDSEHYGPEGWKRVGNDIDGEAQGDQSGISVSLSADGSIVAIGSNKNDGDNGDTSGHVRVYAYDDDDSLWKQRGGDIDGEAQDDFSGVSVSLSADGSIVAIGAGISVYDDETISKRGHVSVYEYNGSSWQKLGEDIDGEAQGDESGFSASLSADGSIVAIGARFNDGNGDNSGHTRVFQIAKRNPWVQQGLDIVDDASNLIEDDVDVGKSKVSVSLSNDGKVLAIGSMLNDGIDGNQRDTGLVRVFENTDGLWKQKGQDIYGVSSDDMNGSSVSLSGDGSKLAVGAPTKANDTLCYVRVYEFNLTNNNWDQVGETIYGEAVGDEGGWSVSLSADGFVVAIGAHENGSKRGHVRVYKYEGSSWGKVGGDIDGEETFDKSGWSVSLSDDGSVVAIGAPFNDNGGPSGHVRVYRNKPGKTGAVTDQNSENFGPVGWDRIGGDIDGDDRFNFNGSSVSLSGDGSIVAISDINNAENGSLMGSGHVRVYRNNPEKTDDVTDQNSPNFGPVGWDRIGGDIDGLVINDQNGYSVSLSTDGSVVAIGAPGNDANGNNSGHVRIYKNINNIWIKQGGDIEGEKSNYYSGGAVSLSSDGLVVAIGGHLASSDEIPRVRVYKFTGWGLGTE